jgi:hypothetical protein
VLEELVEVGGLDVCELLDGAGEGFAGAACTIKPKEGISGAGSSGAVMATPGGRNRKVYFWVWDKISSGMSIFHWYAPGSLTS